MSSAMKRRPSKFSSSDDEPLIAAKKGIVAKEQHGGAVGSDALVEPSDEVALKSYQQMLDEACSNHVESFNLLIKYTLNEICLQLPKMWIAPKNEGEEPCFFWYSRLIIDQPKKNPRAVDAFSKLLPSDCRLGHTTYSAPLRAQIKCQIGLHGPIWDEEVNLGNIPIMVKSSKCHLSGKSPDELMKLREDPSERGGYFIINGNERVIRLLIQQKNNYIIALVRPSFENRGPLYTAKATQIRCLRPDLTTLTNTLHYCRDGTCFFRFSHEKNEWLLPLIVVAYLLCDASEAFIYTAFTGGSQDHYITERVTLMLQRQQDSQIGVRCQKDARIFLGKRFRHMMRNIPAHYTDEEVGIAMADEFFFVHTKDHTEKFENLVMMFQKLMDLSRGKVEPDNCDALSMQDCMLPGQLYGAVLKEALEEQLHRAAGYGRKMQAKVAGWVPSAQTIRDAMEAIKEIDKQMEYFLATGNVRSRTGLDLMQATGFTLVADKINAFRHLSHFRSIHRGAFFTELRTTTVRKLLPDTWGFLCPVHTPDGTPCGLLNHLAARCEAVTSPTPIEDVTQGVRDTLRECAGVIGVDDPKERMVVDPREYLWITLDGRPVGRVAVSSCRSVIARLRDAKLRAKTKVPQHVEIVCITHVWDHLFPGIYMFSTPCRLVRPIRYLKTEQIEWVGPLEQLFLNIAVTEDDVTPQKFGTQTQGTKIGEQLSVDYSHVELSPTEILSFLASMTPFSNHNQSPRNMYQCQMLKQTMGTPYLNHIYRTDNKIYKIHSPQKPMVRTQLYGGMNAGMEHPPGINAVVAVISYTGYDMEDAMILNKGSLERGFFQGSVYKQKLINAWPDKEKRHGKQWKFRTIDSDGKKIDLGSAVDVSNLDHDGFPAIGTKVKRGDPISISMSDGGQNTVEKWKEEECAWLEQINMIGGGNLPSSVLTDGLQRVSLKFRIDRNPIIGDKFASRHGQKGTVAVTWPSENMPFTDSGVVPDILFNPHGFPSRMTVGMLIESIAGKAAMLEGRTADASTFRKYKGLYNKPNNNEDDPFLTNEPTTAKFQNKKKKENEQLEGAAYFGKTLEEHGFQAWGTEKLYNGMTGEAMPVQIFQGVIYYQRLRHMVSDKVQVRAVGKVDPLTKQPIKGRSRHGGIRFGEMERDSLLAHGTVFLLHDRLFRCSDYHIGNVCPECGCLVSGIPSAGTEKAQNMASTTTGLRLLPFVCVPCSRAKNQRIICHRIPIPYVFRYLVCEMAAMNINLRLQIKETDKSVKVKPVTITSKK